MTQLLQIPVKNMVDKYVPISKVYLDQTEAMEEKIEKIHWLASFKPQINHVTAVINETERYEEINIFSVTIKDPDNLHSICVPIFKNIKYPCLLQVVYEKKCLFAACKFHPGKKNPEENILGKLIFSHWIYPEFLSDGAIKFLQNLNEAIIPDGDLSVIYGKICNVLLGFQIYGITKNSVSKLIYSFTGKKQIKGLLDNCTPYKKFPPKNSSIHAKYEKRDRTNTHCFIYRYDIEDLWFAFRTREETKKVIEGRRYRDAEDMVLSVLGQYE